jgi:hypothetical protein
VNANFAGQNLAGANFSNTTLINANFTGANLEGANFSGANLTGAVFVGADLTRANLHNSTLVNANFDPPAASARTSTSVASGTRTKDRGYDRHAVSGTKEGDRQSHRHGPETGAQITGGHRWDAQSWTAHSWNGHPHAGAFDRYIVSDTVTGRAAWHHHDHSRQQQPGGTNSGGTNSGGASGFARYVISGSTGNAPQWQRPASGDASGTHPHHWLRDGLDGANAATHPRWTGQGSAADGARRPHWLARDSGDAQRAHNASALNRFSTAMHGWWQNRQPLWAGGSRAGGNRKPGGHHSTQPSISPKK